jgi:hypothetical protein
MTDQQVELLEVTRKLRLRKCKMIGWLEYEHIGSLAEKSAKSLDKTAFNYPLLIDLVNGFKESNPLSYEDSFSCGCGCAADPVLAKYKESRWS